MHTRIAYTNLHIYTYTYTHLHKNTHTRIHGQTNIPTHRRTPGIPLLTGQVDGYVMTGREVQPGYVYRVAVASRSTVPGYPGRIMLILTVSLTVGVALIRSTGKHTVR